MITLIEADKEGNLLRVFHRSKDNKYKWTHPLEERDLCDACNRGTLPDWVKKSAQ
jgi:hypothetical protein